MIISKIIIELLAFIIHIITFMTFWPADSEDGQIFICGIFCDFFGIACWHILAFELPMAFFEFFVQQGSLVTTNHRLGWRHQENAPKKKYQTHAENCQMPKKKPQTLPNAKKIAKQMLKKILKKYVSKTHLHDYLRRSCDTIGHFHTNLPEYVNELIFT